MRTVIVDTQPGGDFTSIGAALTGTSADTPLHVHVRSGLYREKVFCEKRDLLLTGEGEGRTILRWDDGAYRPHSDGHKTGTFRSYTACFDGERLRVQNLTIENAAGGDPANGQAVAAAVYTKKVWMEHVALLSGQDTLFMGPLPEREREPGGFRGPREYAARVPSQQGYRSCLIRGGIDFIFGGADAYFEACLLQCVRRTGETPGGYIAAPSTGRDGVGFVFNRCLIEGTPAGSFYLGRPWRPYGKAAFLRCRLGSVICPAGWAGWRGDVEEPTARFAEYLNTGPGAAGKRALGEKLAEEEAQTLIRWGQRLRQEICGKDDLR